MKKTYPVGTVLWRMGGRERNGEVYWAAIPQCIQVCNENGFLFDQSMVDFKHGSTWGNIGKNYFLSREECLASWGDKPLIEKDNRPVEAQEQPDPNEYGKQTIWLRDPTSNTYIFVGMERAPFSTNNLEWNVDDEKAEAMGDKEGGYCLTLDEIAKQIKQATGVTFIEVRVESPIAGVIHQTGNYADDLWHKQGTTRGYA